MNMLYTVSMEYRGGTHLSQVTASGESDALRMWARNLNIDEIPSIGPKWKERLVAAIDNDLSEGILPTPVPGFVWCTSRVISGGLVLLTMTATANA